MLNSLSFSYITAEIILIFSSFALILVGLIVNLKRETKLYAVLALIILVIAAFTIFPDHSKEEFIGFNRLFITNRYVVFSKFIILLSGVISILFIMGYSEVSKLYLRYEFIALVLFAILGMMIMLSANDFMSLYLGIELQSLCLYSLTSFNRLDSKCSEAALKYFILGAIATGMILYGISLIYGFSGTTNFSSIAGMYSKHLSGSEIPIAVLIGMVLTIAGLCFKIAAVPFHMWAPDVYQGAPLPITAFLSTTSKVAMLLLFLKLFINVFNIWVDAWQQVIKVIAMLSLFVGALGALRQSDIKRLLAYSSINHIGFVLIGMASHSVYGSQGVVIYVSVYILMNIGMFAFIAMLQRPSAREKVVVEDFDLSIFKGLARSNPIMASSIAVLLLSLAGIPPFAGFLAKFYILSAAIKEGLYLIATLGIASAVISTFYYLKIIKLMYFDSDNIKIGHISYTIENIAIASSATAFNLILILFPTSLNAITIYVAESLFR